MGDLLTISPLYVSIMGTSRHPIPIVNWSHYNKSLSHHGSLTFWVDAAAINNWFHQDHHGRRGRSPLYTDQTICPFLMLKGVFSLSLRATQGLLDSLFSLMNVPLCAPGYTCVSKRAGTLKVAYRQLPKGKITDLLIDSINLEVFGEGEWKVRKHGSEKHRIWRKLHLAVDPASHDIVATEVSLENVHDAEVLPTLLNPLHHTLGTVYADGAYDARACHELIRRKGGIACIPPRNDTVLVMRKEGQPHWKSGIRLSSALGGGDGDIAVQTVDDGKAELAKLQ